MPNSPVDLTSEKAEALVAVPEDLDSRIELVGDARFVLTGEASHGTHEFFRIRVQISKVLIGQCGFNAMVVSPSLVGSPWTSLRTSFMTGGLFAVSSKN
jgi:hypothetical protein